MRKRSPSELTSYWRRTSFLGYGVAENKMLVGPGRNVGSSVTLTATMSPGPLR